MPTTVELTARNARLTHDLIYQIIQDRLAGLTPEPDPTRIGSVYLEEHINAVTY